MEYFLFLILLKSLLSAQKSKILRFQLDNPSNNYSTEEWAEFKGEIPHLNSFTACHWEKIRFFSVRDTVIWSFCYKTKDVESDHHCTQFWHNTHAESGGRHVWINGGFGDKSYGGSCILEGLRKMFTF